MIKNIKYLVRTDANQTLDILAEEDQSWLSMNC